MTTRTFASRSTMAGASSGARPTKYDVIQASPRRHLGCPAGAYTLTENTLYTVEAFTDYLDHLNDNGIPTITRWVFDGLRLVSLAQEACARRGWDAASRLAIVQHDRVATFLLKKSPFTPEEAPAPRTLADRLQFRILYAPERGTHRTGCWRGVEGRKPPLTPTSSSPRSRAAFYDELRAGHQADDR